MAEQRRKQREEISTPTISESLVLRTHQAQQVKKRILSKLLTSMFITDVILRLIADDAEAGTVNKVIAETIDKVDTDLKGEVSRLEKIRDDKAVTAVSSYNKIDTSAIDINSPMGGRFVTILRRLDNMMILVDLLWLTGHLDGAQKKRAGYEWSRRILRAANSVIMLERRTRRAAVRKGKEEEMKEAVGDTETEIIEEDTADPDSATANKRPAARKKVGAAKVDANEAEPAADTSEQAKGGGEVKVAVAAAPAL